MVLYISALYGQKYYKRMKSQSTPYHGNLFKQQKKNTINGHPLTINIVASDIILSEFEGISQKLKSIRIIQMQIRSKQLDKPINPIVSFFATVASIQKNHQFLLFKTQHFLITVDYYQGNRLIIRIGDQHFVFEKANTDKKRRQSTVLQQKNGLLWRVSLNTGQFNVGTLLQLLMHMQIGEHSKVFYNGSHLSKQIFNRIQKDFVKK